MQTFNVCVFFVVCYSAVCSYFVELIDWLDLLGLYWFDNLFLGPLDLLGFFENLAD